MHGHVHRARLIPGYRALHPAIETLRVSGFTVTAAPRDLRRLVGYDIAREWKCIHAYHVMHESWSSLFEDSL